MLDEIGLPAWFSYAVRGSRTAGGHPLVAAYGVLTGCRSLVAAGVNCSDQVDVLGASAGTQPLRVAYLPQSEAVDWSFPVSVLDVVLMGRFRGAGWLRRLSAHDRLESIDRLANPWIAVLGHHEYAEIRREPLLGDDLDWLQVANRARWNCRRRPRAGRRDAFDVLGSKLLAGRGASRAPFDGYLVCHLRRWWCRRRRRWGAG